MKYFLIAIAVFGFFSLTPSALAVSCGAGGAGTCRSQCNASEQIGENTSNSYCLGTAGRTAGLCCMPTSSGACPAGQTRDFDGICFTPTPTPAPTPSGPTVMPSPTSPGTVMPNPTGPQSGQNIKLLNPLQGGESLESFLLNILKFVIRIGAIFVVLMLVYVGFLFVKARGEPGELTKAKEALLWTVVGALILLGAQAIALGIKATVDALSVGQ